MKRVIIISGFNMPYFYDENEKVNQVNHFSNMKNDKLNSYKISIIIPSFNAEKDISRAINSLFNQSIGFENIEVLIVDDCSTDNTRQVLIDYENNYDNIKCIFLKENSGSAGKPRNVGITFASADYIMFLDNDDEYVPEACEILYDKIIDEKTNLIVCSKNNNIYSKNDIIPKITEEPKFEEVNVLANPDVLYSPITQYAGAVWCKIFSKKFLIENNIKCLEKINEDVYFMHQCYYLSPNVLFLTNLALYNHFFYRVEGQSITVSLSFSFLQNAFKMFIELKKLSESFEGTEKFFNRYCTLFFDELAYHIYISNVSRKEKFSLIKEYSKCAKLVNPKINNKLISFWCKLAYNEKFLFTYLYSIFLKSFIKIKSKF